MYFRRYGVSTVRNVLNLRKFRLESGNLTSARLFVIQVACAAV